MARSAVLGSRYLSLRARTGARARGPRMRSHGRLGSWTADAIARTGAVRLGARAGSRSRTAPKATPCARAVMTGRARAAHRRRGRHRPRAGCGWPGPGVRRTVPEGTAPRDRRDAAGPWDSRSRARVDLSERPGAALRAGAVRLLGGADRVPLQRRRAGPGDRRGPDGVQRDLRLRSSHEVDAPCLTA